MRAEEVRDVDALDDARRRDEPQRVRKLRKTAPRILLAQVRRAAYEMGLRHVLQGEERVAPARGRLEVALRRRVLHARLDFAQHLGTLPLQERARLLEARPVIRARHLAEARRRAVADDVREAVAVRGLVGREAVAFADAVALLDEVLRGADDGR